MEVRKYGKSNTQDFESLDMPSPIKENIPIQPMFKNKVVNQENSKPRVTKKGSMTLTQTKISSAKVFSKSKGKDGIEEVLRNVQQPVQDEAEDVISILKSLDPNAKAKEKAASDVAFIFEPRLYDGDSNYAKDGDINFYTQENEKKRAALRTNAMIKDSINNVSSLYNWERDGTLGKEEYIKVNTCIARILRQDLKDIAISKLIEEDWKHDTKGKGVLTRKDVFDSLFEMGDVWTPDVDSYQYVAFFDRLGKILRGREELANKPRSKTSLVNF
jgi:hypothetical protein